MHTTFIHRMLYEKFGIYIYNIYIYIYIYIYIGPLRKNRGQRMRCDMVIHNVKTLKN